jgi:hypothetical protein
MKEKYGVLYTKNMHHALSCNLQEVVNCVRILSRYNLGFPYIGLHIDESLGKPGFLMSKDSDTWEENFP